MKRGPFRTGERAGIWLAITVALLLHAIVLLLPIAKQRLPTQDHQRPVEIELATLKSQKPAMTVPEAETGPREPVAAQQPEALPPANPPENITAISPEIPAPTAPVVPVIDPGFDSMSETERKVLTSTILARQYMTEESAVDHLFGKPLVRETSDFQKEFHYPLRPDLIEMLNQPLPDLPFEYTPGLVYFAYDPGLKGELQRFWDIITPEFGWRTKYGTEVKCALIVIIPGCVWK